tara:strand:- start:506 stop:1303 length:798 start_codon:yes stop_codon:yes gene_type:complete
MADILEKKQIPQELVKYINALRCQNEPIYFEGSASLVRNQYASDIDLQSFITGTPDLFAEFSKIQDKTDKIDNMYFIEGKVQMRDETKVRWYKLEDFVPQMVAKPSLIDFIKLDYVLLLNGIFTELSIIYTIKRPESKRNTTDEILNAIKTDYNGYLKDGQYYKSMKRMFTIIKITDLEGANKVLEDMVKNLFNTNSGKIYKVNSALKAIVLFQEYYKDDQSKRMAEQVYRNLGYKDDIKNIDKHIKHNENIYNQDALDYYETHF